MWPAERAEELGHLLETLRAQPGVYELQAGVYAVVPTPTDPSVFDTAVVAASNALGNLLGSFVPGEYLPDPSAPAILISSAEVISDEQGVRPADDQALISFDSMPPELPGTGVYLTSRAAQDLDESWLTEESIRYQTPAGQSFPIVRLVGKESVTSPRRNPLILSRRISPVPREDVEQALATFIDRPAVHLLGTVGVGKTRLAHTVLTQHQKPTLWTRCRPSRRGGPKVAEQILLHLLEPLESGLSAQIRLDSNTQFREEELRSLSHEWQASSGIEEIWAMVEWIGLISRFLKTGSDAVPCVLVDDFQFASLEDREFVQRLAASPHIGTHLHLWVIDRGPALRSVSTEATETSKSEPPTGIVAGAERFVVPPMDPTESQQHAEVLFEGQALPPEVIARFVRAAAGHPLALEEGLLELPRRKLLRQIYGNYFFNGNESTEYCPSSRLVRHAASEAERLVAGQLPLLLAMAAQAVPADELAEIAGERNGPPASDGNDSSQEPNDWTTAGVESGFLQETWSPWGTAVEYSVPAHALSLVRSTDPDVREACLKPLGLRLASKGSSGEAQWRTYQFLRGEVAGIEPLLRVLKSGHAAKLPREELVEAISRELETSRAADGGPDQELLLLWNLLQLLRRMGNLEGYLPDIQRAIDLAQDNPRILLALASLKAELDQAAGRFDEAEKTIRGALARAKGHNERRQAMLLTQLGKMLLRQERYDEAKALFTNLLGALDAADSANMAADCRYYLGNIAVRQKRHKEAIELHEQALEERERQNLVVPTGSSLSALGAIHLTVGNYPEALSHYRRAEEMLRQYGKEDEVAFALLGLGRAFSRLGDFAAASKPIREALHIREGRDDVAGEAIARMAVAENYLELARPDKALEEARKAHFSLSMLSISWLLANAEQLLGRILLFQRKFEPAQQHLNNAVALHEEQKDLQAGAGDHATLLDLAIHVENDDNAYNHVHRLMKTLELLEQPDREEQLNFEVARGLSWLKERGRTVPAPESYLRRAYELLLRKASHLDPEQRHQFLFGIEANRQILHGADPAQAGGTGA